MQKNILIGLIILTMLIPAAVFIIIYEDRVLSTNTSVTKDIINYTSNTTLSDLPSAFVP